MTWLRLSQLVVRGLAVVVSAVTGQAVSFSPESPQTWAGLAATALLLLGDLFLHRAQIAKEKAVSVSSNVPPVLLALALFLPLSGCMGALHPATVDAIQAQAITCRRTADAFQAMAPKLAPTVPSDAAAVDMWKIQHAVNLEAQAAGMESLAKRVKE